MLIMSKVIMSTVIMSKVIMGKVIMSKVIMSKVPGIFQRVMKQACTKAVAEEEGASLNDDI